MFMDGSVDQYLKETVRAKNSWKSRVHEESFNLTRLSMVRTEELKLEQEQIFTESIVVKQPKWFDHLNRIFERKRQKIRALTQDGRWIESNYRGVEISESPQTAVDVLWAYNEREKECLNVSEGSRARLESLKYATTHFVLHSYVTQ